MTTCSHVLIKVDQLSRAVADYRALGFDVRYATDPRKALHAHIWFPAGPVVELLATPRLARLFRWPLELAFGRGSGRRMLGWARQPEGFCDLAVLVEDAELDRTRAALARQGIACGRAVKWSRVPPDGPRTRFRFSYPRADRLPFLVTPYDPPQHPPEVRHPNGATAIARVVLGVAPADRRRLLAVVGDDPVFELREAQRTGVLAVALSGLVADLDPVLAHGAVLQPVPARC